MFLSRFKILVSSIEMSLIYTILVGFERIFDTYIVGGKVVEKLDLLVIFDRNIGKADTTVIISLMGARKKMREEQKEKIENDGGEEEAVILGKQERKERMGDDVE